MVSPALLARVKESALSITGISIVVCVAYTAAVFLRRRFTSHMGCPLTPAAIAFVLIAFSSFVCAATPFSFAILVLIWLLKDVPDIVGGHLTVHQGRKLLAAVMVILTAHLVIRANTKRKLAGCSEV